MNLSVFLSTARPIMLDGAMGTQLAKAGLDMGGQNNLLHPETVRRVHQQYAACGVHLLIANTLTMNRVYIEAHDLGVDVRQVNLAGAELARSAAGPGQYVLGDLSSTGQMLEPYGPLSEADATRAFREQAAILVEGGVDGLIIETMFDLREALCALRACRAVTALPVLVSIAFASPDRGGRTVMGNTAQECAEALTQEEATVVGANCGDLTPTEMAQVVATFSQHTSLPVLAQPNAGKPRLVEGRTLFDMPPDAFAAGIDACLRAGARLVGGCCGTSPAHMRAVIDRIGPAFAPPSGAAHAQ